MGTDLGGDVSDYLTNLAGSLRDLLGERLVGAYVYGSLTMDSFRPGKSDVDVVAVVTGALTDAERAGLVDAVPRAPLPAAVRGLDLSVVDSLVTAEPIENACWEAMIQVSRTDHGPAVRERERCDPRLPLDLALVRQHGTSVVGPPAGEVFGPVSAALVLAACTENVRLWANRDVIYDPSSGVLNVCRAWRYFEEGLLVSKTEAGAWALARGAPRALVEGALGTYRGQTWPAVPDADVKSFFRSVLALLERDGR